MPTVDTYGHLIAGANVSFVDRLDVDEKVDAKAEGEQQNATQAQLPSEVETPIPPEVADSIGGGGRTRTYDLRIMSSEPPVADKQDKELSSAESGKLLQDPQPPRTNLGPKQKGEL